MPTLNVEKNKQDSIVKAYRAIKADDSGDLPSKIMLVQAGEWPDSVKGNLSISVGDLLQMKMNFDNGVARPGQGLGLPIDFSHNEWEQAAGWINELEVDGDTLYSVNTEWSDAGKSAILGKMFKCISPSFYPAGRGGWQDPENLEVSVDNVLVGAGLTNIPFFKGLSAVKASALSETDTDDRIIYINKSVNATKEEEPVMNLADIRVKAQADLTAEEEKFIADNSSELTAEEKEKFGIEDTAQVEASAKAAEEAKISAAATQGVTFTDEEKQIVADIRSGKSKIVDADAAIVTADELASLKETAEQSKIKAARDIVEAHVERGAIKADRVESWTNRLLASTEETRAELEADLSALPSNELLAGEKGSSAEVTADADARKEIADLAGKLVEAAKAEGKELSYSDAQSQVLASNPDLAERDRSQNKF